MECIRAVMYSDHHCTDLLPSQHTCCCNIRCETKEETMRRLEKEFEGAEKAPGAAGICVTADRTQIKVCQGQRGGAIRTKNLDT